jgi:hypothetical protein
VGFLYLVQQAAFPGSANNAVTVSAHRLHQQGILRCGAALELLDGLAHVGSTVIAHEQRRPSLAILTERDLHRVALASGKSMETIRGTNGHGLSASIKTCKCLRIFAVNTGGGDWN